MACLYLLLCLILASSVAEKCGDVSLKEDIFGYTKDNVPVRRFTWTNTKNMTVQVINYGGRLISAKVPDKHGNIEDVVLGYDNLEDYLEDNTYFGATLGRVSNRIVGASFRLDGVQYNLTANENGNTLHGGTKGFDKVIWEPYVHDNELTLSYVSKDGENGFPGTVITQVNYVLTPDGELIFKVRAMTTKPTPLSISNHGYYNLAGQSAGPEGIYQHTVLINADNYLETTPAGAPTGEIDNVEGTSLDFRVQRTLGPLMHQRGGYDNNFCIQLKNDNQMRFVARVEHPESGRILIVHSDQPGVQFYTGNNIPKKESVNAIVGKGGIKYDKFGSVSLETQGYPDAVNHANFPSVIMTPGKEYHHTSSFKFSTRQSVIEEIIEHIPF